MNNYNILTPIEHKNAVMAYMATLPAHSNRFEMCFNLLKDLDSYKPTAVAIPQNKLNKKCKYKDMAFESISEAAHFLDLSIKSLYDDIYKRRFKHRVYLAV